MSHEPKPSEHAMRAAKNWCSYYSDSVIIRLTNHIDQHAIRPAVAELTRENEEQARLLGAGGSREAALMAKVAERDRRIAELEELIHNGWYVFKHLSEAEKKYTSAENVSAVLNAFKRAAFPKSERSAP